MLFIYHCRGGGWPSPSHVPPCSREPVIVGDDGGLLVLVQRGEAAERVEAAQGLTDAHAAQVVGLAVGGHVAIVQVVLDTAGLCE